MPWVSLQCATVVSPTLYGDLVHKLKNIVGTGIFSVQFIKLKDCVFALMYCNKLQLCFNL